MVKKSYSNRALGATLVLWVATIAAIPWILAVPDKESGALTAVFQPGIDDAELLPAVARAGGRMLRGGRFDNVVVVHSDLPGFAGRLRRAGAWTVLSTRIAAGCLLIPSMEQTLAATHPDG